MLQSLQIDFLDKVNQFAKFHLVKTENSVTFDPKKIIIKQKRNKQINWLNFTKRLFINTFKNVF